MSNYQQPDYRVPVSPGVTVQVENILNPLVIVAPVPKYNQPLDHPLAPASNQLSDAMGKSKKTFADGSTSST